MRGESPAAMLQAIIGLGAIQALTMLAGLIRTKVLALLLGPEGLGIAGVIDQVVALVVQLGSLSLPLAALKFLSKRSGDLAALTEMFGGLLRLILIASLLATGVTVALAVGRPDLLGAELEQYRVPLVAALLTAPALAVGAMLRSTLATLARHREAALSALIGALFMVAFSYLGVRLGGLTGLYVGNLFVHGPLVVLLLVYLARSAGVRVRLWVRQPFRVIRDEPGLVRFCTVIHFLTLASPVAYLGARVSILAHHGAETAGLFYAAYGLAVAMRVVLNQANGLYLSPILNRPTPKQDRVVRAAGYTRGLVALLLAAAAGPILFPRIFLVGLYSPQFVAAQTYLGWFVLSEGTLLIAGVFQAVLIGFDDLRSHLYISLLGNLTILTGSLVLIPAMGPLGAAAAFSAGHGLMLVLSVARLVVAHRAIPLLKPTGVSVGVLGLLAGGAAWVGQTDVAAAWRLGVLGLVVVGALFLMQREERNWLLAPVRRLRHWGRRS